MITKNLFDFSLGSYIKLIAKQHLGNTKMFYFLLKLISA